MTISPVFHNTRPEGELPPQEAAAFDLLEALHIDYDRVSHDAAFNMELCAQVSDVLGVSVCKNLFLCNRQQTKFYLLCMSPDKVFPHQGAQRADQLRPAELRPGGQAVGAAALHSRLGHYFGAAQRHGAPRPAADGAGRVRSAVHITATPLPVYQHAEAENRRRAGEAPAAHGPYSPLWWSCK